MPAKATVRGGNQIKANLRRVAQRVPKEMDSILRESLEPMKQEMEQNARALRQPGRPRGGHLDQGVVIVKRDSKTGGKRVFWISFKNRARKIAHLVEFGTAPHWQPRRGRMHPGARAKPFARPAFESEKGETVSKVGQGIARAIQGGLIGILRK